MILVKPTLQIEDAAFPNIFAMGDVADTGAPKMARSAIGQTGVVVNNILSLIRDRAPVAEYKSHRMVDAALKLTLGKASTPRDLSVAS